MRKYLPSFIWTIALLALFFMNGSSTTSFCLSKLAGLGECWGCGIGHAIHYCLHFQFHQSIQSHWLGIPSTVALIWLIIKPFTPKHTPNEPTTTTHASRHTSR